MPALYRSKSVRRFEESTNRLTNLIENDNIKVLATAAVQLFISTPQLDKWFKSSTGTLCFLKDFNRKNFYYFRLYSLMQGQLWEQEMECPFVYSKLSCIFHYLAVNRFNFGFRFICEDEAERFYSVITKFSVIKMSDNETTATSNAYTQISGSLSDNTSKSFQRNVSATPLGSIATAAAAVASATVMANSNHSSSTNTLTNWSTGSTSTIKAVAKYVCSPDTSSNEAHRSRRPAYSAERKRKIDKRDISCPFRCSCTDLHLTKVPSIEMVQTLGTVDTVKTSNHYEKSEKLHQSKKISQRALNEINSLLKRRSSSVQRAQSSASDVSPNKENDAKKPSSVIPNSSTTCSPSTSSNSNNSKSQLIKPVVMREKRRENKALDSNLTNSCSNLKDDGELEIIKEILIKYNVPIDRKFIKCLREYICNKYGDIDTFNKALETVDELKKFNTFVAEYSASLIISTDINKSPENTNFISFSNQRFETTWKTPTNQHQPIYVNTPSTPTITMNSTKNRYSFCNSYQTLTPVSSNSKSKPPSDSKTPKSNNLTTALNLNKTRALSGNKTPSPSPQHEKLRQQLIHATNTTPNSIDNAPPKPPRRISLLISN